MQGGRIDEIGFTDAITDKYLANGSEDSATMVRDWTNEQVPRGPNCSIRRIWVEAEGGKVVNTLDCRQSFSINIEFDLEQSIRGLRVGFALHTMEGLLLCGSNDPFAWPSDRRGPGRFISRCEFPGNCLNAGMYRLDVAMDSPGVELLMHLEGCVTIPIEDVEGHGPYHEQLPGVMRPKLHWSVEKL
jgi:hypothetical protein